MLRTTLKTKMIALVSCLVLFLCALFLFYTKYICKWNYSGTGFNIGEGFRTGIFWAFILIALSVITFAMITYSFINKTVLIPLQRIKDGSNAIKSGDMSFRLNMGSSDEIGEIACAFDEMTAGLEESYSSLEEKTAELSERNLEMKEANTELEAAYGQMQAIIEQLNEAEQKYHSLVRNIPEMVCVIDYHGVISFINHKCTDILGYEKSDLTGKSILELFDIESAGISINDIISILETKREYVVEIRFVKKDGELIITEANFTNYNVNGINMGLQMIIRDITVRRQLEDDIVQSNKELAILNSISKSLASTIDLNELSRLVVSNISRLLNVPACTLHLNENEDMSLRIKAFAGTFFNNAMGSKVLGPAKLKEKMLESSMNENKVLRIDRSDERWSDMEKEGDEAGAGLMQEVLYIPVNTNNKKVGVLSLGTNRPLLQNEMNMLTSIATSAAVAIDNAMLYETSRKYFLRTIDALIAAVEAKDKYTEGHSQRVSKYAVHIAYGLGLEKEQIEDIKVAGILHDIGKIGISDNILSKPGKLTKDEYEEIKKHPAISNKILYPVGFSDRTLKAIAFHHERYDGKGYPFGLQGEGINIEAQIISVADAYDAMTSDRSYRKSMTSFDALKELKANCRTQFSTEVVNALSNIVEKIKR